MPRDLQAQGERIRSTRRARDLTQRQVADALGITVQSVSQWENGRSRPHGDHAIALGRLLQIDWTWLQDGNRRVPEPVSTSPASVLECLTAYVREHGKRGGLYDQLLPKADQPGTIAMAMDLVDGLVAVHGLKTAD